MTTAILNNETLNMDQLNLVAGGTFTPNKYDERIYNQAGISTDYHFFAKDEFFAKNKDGKEMAITYDQANWAVEYWQTHNKQPSYELIIKNCKD